jgi:hypothetical protein
VSLVGFDSHLDRQCPYSGDVVLYIRQDSPFGHVLKGAPALPTFFISITQAQHKYSVVKGRPHWDPISCSIKEVDAELGCIWLESEDKSHPPSTVLVQASSRVASRSVLVITDMEELGTSVEEMTEEREMHAGPLQRRPELFQQALSSGTLANGFKIETQVKMHDVERRSYVLRMDVHGP